MLGGFYQGSGKFAPIHRCVSFSLYNWLVIHHVDFSAGDYNPFVVLDFVNDIIDFRVSKNPQISEPEVLIILHPCFHEFRWKNKIEVWKENELVLQILFPV